MSNLSALELSEEELYQVKERLVAVLDYAQKVAQAPVSGDYELAKNVNVLVEDVARPTDPVPLLSLAPEIQDNCFIVPSIIEKK